MERYKVEYKEKKIEDSFQSSYEKPLFEKQTTLNFPEKIWEMLNEGKFPNANCSRCHHCR